jgi:asparagine synthase (glutamine-hydrolysing)
MRARPTGRIGGLTSPAGPEVVAALRAALDAGAQILGDAGLDLVADWDACFLDGRPIRDLAHWRVVVGEGRLARVSGAFALAWREPDGTLGLARDAIGERTLYYARTSGAGPGLVFASALRAILATGLLPRRLDLASLGAYLAYAYVPGPATLVQGACELRPGEVLRYRDGALSCVQRWSPPAEPPDPGPGDADEPALRGRLRATLETAVARRLPAGEAVGATLSGGVDSSLVVALASRLHDEPVHTYSIHFGAPYPNELRWSQLVAQHCGTRHQVVELTPASILQHLDATVAQLSDPIGDPLTVPNALVFRAAAGEVGVVLNGEGGDPCFGGPKNLPMLLAALLGDGGDASAGGEGLEGSYLRAHGKCYDDLPAMLAAEARDALAARPLESFLAPYFAEPRWRRFVTRLQAMNVLFKGAHHILHKVDEVSAPAGVLPRSPLFDRDLVELAFALPPELKLRGSVEKYLLKQAVADLLPPGIVERPKSGMLVPVEGWFRGPLLPHARARLLDGLAPHHLFDRSWLERLLAGRLGGLHPRHGAKIWLLVTLEAWLREVFARA